MTLKYFLVYFRNKQFFIFVSIFIDFVIFTTRSFCKSPLKLKIFKLRLAKGVVYKWRHIIWYIIQHPIPHFGTLEGSDVINWIQFSFNSQYLQEFAEATRVKKNLSNILLCQSDGLRTSFYASYFSQWNENFFFSLYFTSRNYRLKSESCKE